MIFPSKIDMHMHTTTSVGTDTPEMLLTKIREKNIDMFAITDHDAISVCDDMRILLKIEERKGAENLPVFVNGVEFSCRDNYGRYHILGYAYDPAHPAIREMVDFAHAMRMTKLSRRFEFLEEEFGIVFPKEDIEDIYSMDNPGKPHLGNLLVKYGHAPDRSAAIKKYLNHVTYQGRVHVFPEEAAEAILNAGGIPVLAHPPLGDGGQQLDDREMRRRLNALKLNGLMGLEAWYSAFSKDTTEWMLALAHEFDLMATAGSDYHGEHKKVPLGETGLASAADGGLRVKAFIEACQERENRY